MSDVTEGEPMIEELARPAEIAHLIDDDAEETLRIFRGILIAVALGLSVWGGLAWALTRVV
jgi:hypothetical protein